MIPGLVNKPVQADLYCTTPGHPGEGAGGGFRRLGQTKRQAISGKREPESDKTP